MVQESGKDTMANKCAVQPHFCNGADVTVSKVNTVQEFAADILIKDI
jgi:hypothetical protein